MFLFILFELGILKPLAFKYVVQIGKVVLKLQLHRFKLLKIRIITVGFYLGLDAILRICRI